MKKIFCWAGFVAALYVIQTSLLTLLSYHGLVPDLLLIFVVSLGFTRGARYGVLLGFGAGLLQDVASGTFFGINIFGKMLIGYICGFLSDRVFHGKDVLTVIATVAATIVNYFIFVAIVILLGYPLEIAQHMKHTLLPMMWLNLLFAYPIQRLTRYWGKRLQRIGS